MDYRNAAEDLMHLLKSFNKSIMVDKFRSFNSGEIPVLSYLKSHESEPIVPTDIGKSIQISTARVTTILNSLEEKGDIKREINRSDRRQILVTLTNSGESRFTCAKTETLNFLAKILEKMGEANTQAFLQTFEKFFEIGANLSLKEKEAENERLHEYDLKEKIND